MSVIVTMCLRDGIVMAADSRTTITHVTPDARKYVIHRDGIKKIFQFGNIAISWYGNARIGDQKVEPYLIELFDKRKGATIKEFAEIINTDCKARVRGDPIGCHIAGYEKDIQCVYGVVDGKVSQLNINPDTNMPSICIIWDGERRVSHEIIHGNEKLDIGDGLIVDQSDLPSFSYEVGVKFVEAMLKKSCAVYDTCGEPIFSLVITAAGLQWVHQ